jgi:hypothetical protein
MITINAPRPIHAVVIGDGVTAYAGNRTINVHDYVVPGMLHDIGSLLELTSVMFAGNDEGVVILPCPPIPPALFDTQSGIEDMGEPSKVEQLREIRADAAAAGWTMGEAAIALEERGEGSGWATFQHAEMPTVHIGILPWMSQADTPLFRTDGTWKPEHIATALARYHVATGVAWRANAGASGHAMIRRMARRKDPKRPGRFLPEPRWRQDRWDANNGIVGRGDVIWHRTLTAAEKKMRYVHQWDMRSAYLAAMAAANYGWDPIQETGPGVDGMAAGYYILRLTPDHQRLLTATKNLPPILNPARVNRGLVPVTQPVLAHLRELGYNPEIITSYTSERSGRYLRPAAERLRDAMIMGQAAGLPALRQALKETANRANGLMARPGGRIYRRDWSHTTEDTAAVSILRRIGKVWAEAELAPIEVRTDAVFYASDIEDPRELPVGELLGVGPRIGNMAYEGMTEMAVYLAGRRKARR